MKISEAYEKEDRKIYAEVVYSQLISQINAIERDHILDYLMCVVSQEPYDEQFVYTDGLPEANDSDENMFGMDRVIETLNNNKTASPDEILGSMKASVDAFVKDAEPFDDLTMMCLSYK